VTLCTSDVVFNDAKALCIGTYKNKTCHFAKGITEGVFLRRTDYEMKIFGKIFKNRTAHGGKEDIYRPK
jgi:hypothetical protein